MSRADKDISSSLPVDQEKLVEQLRDPKTAAAAFNVMMKLYGERINNV